MSSPFLPSASLAEDTQQHVRSQAADGQIAYTLTGIVGIVDGENTESGWSRFSVNWSIKVPELAPGKRLQLSHWAALVTLNSFGGPPSSSAAWAVDRFFVSNTEQANPYVVVGADLALNGKGAIIYRIAYCVNLLGREI